VVRLTVPFPPGLSTAERGRNHCGGADEQEDQARQVLTLITPERVNKVYADKDLFILPCFGTKRTREPQGTFSYFPSFQVKVPNTHSTPPRPPPSTSCLRAAADDTIGSRHLLLS